MKKILGFDLGGTKVLAAVLDQDFNILSRVKMKAKQETDLEGTFLAELEENAMMKALGLAMKGEVEVR